MNSKIKMPEFAFILVFFIGMLVTVNFMIMGFFPIKVELNVVDNIVNARILKRSIFSPFKYKATNVLDIQRAVISDSISKGRTNYRVELETSNYKTVPITKYYNINYRDNRNLQNKINESIKNKNSLREEFKQIHLFVLGLFFFVFFSIINIIICFSYKNKYKYKYIYIGQKKNKVSKKHTDNGVEPIVEKDKYNSINNLIIK